MREASVKEVWGGIDVGFVNAGIAEPVVLLASDASTDLVGAELSVDGGLGQG